MKKKVKVINNADDFGYSRGINYGIIDCYQKGVLTSTTIMPGMPGFDHAIALAKENPGLAIGVHLTLTCGKPLLKTHKTIVDRDGYFQKRDFYLEENTTIDDEEVYQEWKAQIQKVLQEAITITHLDSHHHSHTFKNNQAVIVKLAKEYNLPIRNSYTARQREEGKEVIFGSADAGSVIYKKMGIVCNEILIDPWLKLDIQEIDRENTQTIVDAVIQSIEENKNLDVIEVMWHPAYIDREIKEGSSFHLPRIYETAALLDETLMTYLKKETILSTYKDILEGENK